MTAKTITGTWAAICQHQSELQGHQLRVTILPEPKPEAEIGTDEWIRQYRLKMKSRTPEEIAELRVASMSRNQPQYVLPPGKTALDVYLELARKVAKEEPETEEEARAMDEAIRELS